MALSLISELLLLLLLLRLLLLLLRCRTVVVSVECGSDAVVVAPEHVVVAVVVAVEAVVAAVAFGAVTVAVVAEAVVVAAAAVSIAAATVGVCDMEGSIIESGPVVAATGLLHLTWKTAVSLDFWQEVRSSTFDCQNDGDKNLTRFSRHGAIMPS
ncbi:hypothetical protein BCR41DRAFT_384444 [Lobosporangium transversale]|uniref:Uncharacterized protein n=1 Tax=Lobosporangium transversale TaxID=64571 RepID=A0A1Y2GVM1_9FUNG|nr:hypothetical protein BCR41DRAFT_384444 [Lobosporangium transversale]ORZ26338.1 hypothetical protein BCR41DRAFT_384444 [Lobosporangium transversale]|eukprot:XP_021884103.1 hypothetical protein BCR41DRAFT_384444 [Lobosporangium transversale]